MFIPNMLLKLLLGISMLSMLIQPCFATESQNVFIAKIFGMNAPAVKLLWVDKQLKVQIKKILKHNFHGLRVRYWQLGAQTVWILDEIGKELPITIGVAIANNKVQEVSVLKFRESRGGDIRHSFFTNQFIGSQLGEALTLDTNIDGITGATLSVRALTRVVKVALLFHNQVTKINSNEISDT